jgi:hypothetical protein
MQTEQIVSLLIAERDRLNTAIQALQGSGSAKRRGRPAVKTASVSANVPVQRKAVVWDAAKKKAQSDKIKAFWAAKRKKTAKG